MKGKNYLNNISKCDEFYKKLQRKFALKNKDKIPTDECIRLLAIMKNLIDYALKIDENSVKKNSIWKKRIIYGMNWSNLLSLKIKRERI